MTWRTGAMALGICAAALAWQNARLRAERFHGVGASAVTSDRAESDVRPTALAVSGSAIESQEEREATGESPLPPRRHWAVDLLRLREGEDLPAYRDRVLPIAQAVLAPQRLRVTDRRRSMAASAGLDSRQERELDAAVLDASDEIVNRVWQAIANEEIWPRPRPSAGVGLAADLLSSVTSAERRFRSALRDDQLAAVDRSGFDFVDHLLFSVPWEERFGIEPAAAP